MSRHASLRIDDSRVELHHQENLHSQDSCLPNFSASTPTETGKLPTSGFEVAVASCYQLGPEVPLAHKVQLIKQVAFPSNQISQIQGRGGAKAPGAFDKCKL